jgi:UDP:flavonoid glycosyltransferase YjiC (YdhE family)
LLQEPIIPRDENAMEIFCYLRDGPGLDRLDEISACLEGLPGRVVAYLPGLSDARRAALRQAGVEVTDGPPSPAAQLAKSRLFVGYGGHGMAAAALLAGVPQIILSIDVEKYLIANALTERGLAQHFDYRFAEPDQVRVAIEAALDDPAMLMEAERTASEHAEYRNRDVAAEIAAFCGGMLV